MIATNQTLTRSATSKDLSKLANLIHFEAYVHRHLDYRPPLDWIGNKPFLLLEHGDQLEAALACPPDPPSVAWVRLFAATSRVSPEYAWNTLWNATLPMIGSDPDIRFIAAIPLYSWFENILKKFGFSIIQEIVMLNREIKGLPEEVSVSQVCIRPMSMDDLRTVYAIDVESFSPIWVNSPTYIELAFRQALVATMAEIDGQAVGYQISTGTPIGGHLARLAVRPQMQGRGIGYALLNDLIRQLTRRGARVITVNTQKDNRASLSLYQRAGFEPSGEEYPIYRLEQSNIK